ncbi:hypothetical protein LTR05_008216 [Lithohypha guttulata]|uniref:Uncharacterized protein n=1 Tax=Lithohypha guttulata TaxID=1690604 RepID=A0AAN7STD8_9EURO|nr:hypothetical protein LTR05_008216 [Lithohypha guttulata]
MSRTNDGLDPSSTTDAYSSSRGADSQGANYRSNDGLDASGTSDAYGSTTTSSRTRGTDGLDTNTSDVYDTGSSGRGDYGGGAYRTTDGLDPGSTSDARGGTINRGGDTRYDDRTSGGLGADDTIGSNTRTGGAGRGGDQETSQYTSGGLGADDTYGTEGDTGGNDTGYDHNYGMGTGRTVEQEKGGILPTEPGRVDSRGEEQGLGHSDRGADTTSTSQSGSGGDSTMGKMMEKAGGMFKNEKLQQRGEEKRREAGAVSFFSSQRLSQDFNLVIWKRLLSDYYSLRSEEAREFAGWALRRNNIFPDLQVVPYGDFTFPEDNEGFNELWCRGADTEIPTAMQMTRAGHPKLWAWVQKNMGVVSACPYKGIFDPLDEESASFYDSESDTESDPVQERDFITDV